MPDPDTSPVSYDQNEIFSFPYYYFPPAGPLAAGDSVVLNLDLSFQAPSLAATNGTWVNYGEIASAQDLTGATRDDVDSDAGSNGIFK